MLMSMPVDDQLRCLRDVCQTATCATPREVLREALNVLLSFLADVHSSDARFAKHSEALAMVLTDVCNIPWNRTGPHETQSMMARGAAFTKHCRWKCFLWIIKFINSVDFVKMRDHILVILIAKVLAKQTAITTVPTGGIIAQLFEMLIIRAKTIEKVKNYFSMCEHDIISIMTAAEVRQQERRRLCRDVLSRFLPLDVAKFVVCEFVSFY